GSPGVPDFYQGTELWDLSLVDPDNRRPVDFDERRRALDDVSRIMALETGARVTAIGPVLDRWVDGRIKLLVTTIGLQLRQRLSDLFLDGDYLALDVESAVAAGVVSFARTHEDRALIVIAPHLAAGVTDNGHLPVGDRWATSRIILPASLGSRTYR